MNPTPFDIAQNERVTLLIDGPSLRSSCQSIGCEIDFQKLFEYFKSNYRLHRALYFTNCTASRRDSPTTTNFLDRIEQAGFSVVCKVVDPDELSIDANFRTSNQVAITTEMMLDGALENHHIILFANYADLGYAVDIVTANGCKVTVVAVDCGEASIHAILRHLASHFVHLATIKHLFARSRQFAPVYPGQVAGAGIHARPKRLYGAKDSTIGVRLAAKGAQMASQMTRDNPYFDDDEPVGEAIVISDMRNLGQNARPILRLDQRQN